VSRIAKNCFLAMINNSVNPEHVAQVLTIPEPQKKASPRGATY